MASCFVTPTLSGKGQILLVGLTWLLLGCPSSPTASEEHGIPVQWNPRLEVDSLDHLDQRLAARWVNPLTMRPPRSSQQDGVEPISVDNCLTYFEKVHERFQSSPLKDQQLEGANCHAVNALKHAIPSKKSLISTFELNESVVDELPPTLALIVSNDDQRRIEQHKAQGLSWTQAEKIIRVTARKNHSLLVEGESWAVRLQIYAKGDFNQDGFEDVLMKTHGWMTEGTFEVVRLLLLTRTEPNAQLTLVKEYDL